jgi:hypothetical protein
MRISHWGMSRLTFATSDAFAPAEKPSACFQDIQERRVLLGIWTEPEIRFHTVSA